MKKIIFTVLITTSLFSGSIFAVGQGAIAGSASMYLATAGTTVGHVSSSVAIGKANAYTTGNIVLGADAAASISDTSATGAADAIAIDGSGVITVTSEAVAGLDSVQRNVMNTGTVSLDTTLGTDSNDTPSFVGTAN